MEYASFLAGEKFSDHPSCTHPMLAAMARNVNDAVSDEARRRLVPLVSRVVGLVGADPLVEPTLTVLAATTAMPVASFEHQKVLAVGLIRSEQELETFTDRDVSHLLDLTDDGLNHCSSATAWAQRFVERPWGRGQDFTRAAPHVVNLAILSISGSPAADDLLCTLLEKAVDECEALLRVPEPYPVQPALPTEALEPDTFDLLS